jgi:mono/diheme cytochrome c family protein
MEGCDAGRAGSAAAGHHGVPAASGGRRPHGRLVSYPGRRIAALLLGAAVLLVSCDREPSYPPTAEGLFLSRCSRCHEADGSSATASKLANLRIDLRSSFFQKNITNREIRDIIQHGVGKMQGIPNLTPAQIDSLVLHVRRLGAQPAS